MPITNISRSVDLNTSGIYLGHPAGRNIDEGYWIIYSASTAANTLNLGKGLVKGYKWGTQLPTSRTDGFMQLDGTIQLVSESLSGSSNWVNYHGSNIIHIGAGVNDITEVIEDDALFFSHMGQYGSTVQTIDDFFYWDRLFLQDGESNWQYYNYHAHNPTSYVTFNNGRQTFGADDRHGPVGIEEYAYMINVEVSVMGTTYLSVLARVHTPSVGGAHNSHNDVQLPSVSTKNYMMGGIMNGTSDRFHAFYITANGSDWTVYSRTYNYVNSVFNAEVDHGTYDLADPLVAYSPGSSSLYPFRASAGTLYNSRIYIPVLYRSGSTGFDVKIWDFASAANLTATPTVTNLITGSIVRPDCHLAIANNDLYAAVSDITDGGVSLYKLSGSNWVDEGQIVTNNKGKYLRVHGLEYNSEEIKFYIMISGDASGSGTTYSGSGVYSFTPDIPFSGYTHLDYITGSNSFIVRDPLEAGYLQYSISNGTYTRKSGTEPQGVSTTTPVVQYDVNSQQFYDRRQIGFGGNEGFNHGIELQDGRQLYVGTKAAIDPEFDISYTNGILTFISPGGTTDPDYFEIEGRFDDFITGVCQSTGSGKIYFTGFTKDMLANRRDIFIHGIGRGLYSGNNKFEWVDLVVDLDTTNTSGSQYYVGNHIESSSILIAKYDYNFDLQWQREIYSGSGTDVAYGITRDRSGSLYIAGATNASGSGNSDALLVKLDSTGSILWTKLYGTSAAQTASSVAIIHSGSTDYILMSVVSGSNTTIVSLNTDGTISEQNTYNNFVINRIRRHETTTDGKFVIAGHDGGSPKSAKFGVGAVNNGSSMLNWVRTYNSASADVIANDMRNTGTVPEYMVAGQEGNDGFVMKLLENSGTVTKSWATTTSGSLWRALANTTASIASASRFTYAVGYTSASGNAVQGGGDGVIARFDSTGNMPWINALGHTDGEQINAIEIDVTQYNLITAGWSESHTDGRRALLFRAARNGFGTGNHHLEGAPGMALWYESASALIRSTGLGTLSVISTPTNSTGNLLTSASIGFVAPTSSLTGEIYEGSQVFDGYLGVIDITDIQAFKNTSDYVPGELNRINDLATFYQIGVAGDGQADDGNIFAYDVIELTSGSNAGKIAIAAQTSGDITRKNLGLTGVYDYMIAFFTPSTGEFVIWQNGTALDEEIYALKELQDGEVAFVGRTAGNLGGEPVGGYDIFLGIINPETLAVDYYTTGSGNNDRGFNLHDIHEYVPNTLAVVYETSGDFGGTNAGPSDIGVVYFNYVTDEWSNAQLIGSIQNEFIDTLGNISAYIPDGRIAIIGSTTGVFADDGNTYGQSDVFLAIYDIATNTWKKYQIGTGAADFGRSVYLATNNKLLIAGTTAASFTEPSDGIVVNFDIGKGFKTKHD